MKHLKTINELNKKTYISAANKLKQDHPDRAEELRNWAIVAGIPEDNERICPNRYNFQHREINKKDVMPDEYFSLVDIKNEDINYRNDNKSVVKFGVDFKSNYGTKVKLVISLDDTGDITNFYSSSGYESNYQFKFRSRKDARAFKKFLYEYVEDCINDGDEYFEECEADLIKNIRLNSLYTTAEDPRDVKMGIYDELTTPKKK